MVINLRGTSGCGKSTTVRKIMERYTFAEPIGSPKKPEGYRLMQENLPTIYVVGSYETICGGCDTIPTQDEICRRVRVFAEQGNVLVEGLLMSHIFTRYLYLSRELKERGIPFIFAFLDTPLDTCLARVQSRRDARGAKTEFNPKNTIDKWNDMRRVFQKCIHNHADARWIDHANPDEVIWAWLMETV